MKSVFQVFLVFSLLYPLLISVNWIQPFLFTGSSRSSQYFVSCLPQYNYKRHWCHTHASYVYFGSYETISKWISSSLVLYQFYNYGAKYLVFFSSRSLQTREKYISFAQFVHFLREVCLHFNFWMMKFTIMFFLT